MFSLFNFEVKSCVADYLKEFRKNFLFEKCQQFCPEECDSMSYTLNNYYEPFPISGSLSSTLRNNTDLKVFKTYDEMQKTYIRLYLKMITFTSSRF